MSARTPFLLAVVCLLLTACGPQELLDNYYVDRWCDDAPCAWEVAGEIEQIGSWHPRDHAISFETPGTAISQWNDEIDDRVGCVEVSMLARIEADAHLVFTFDYDDDGLIENERELEPSESWAPRSFTTRLNAEFDGIRFTLRKEGNGVAEVAQLRALGELDCARLPL
ncbi:MAG: hypothetical protein OXT09_16625 [Myxococcales bacterium]|nr:hypothetical protein [Myxococcales bacterium]